MTIHDRVPPVRRSSSFPQCRRDDSEASRSRCASPDRAPRRRPPGRRRRGAAGGPATAVSTLGAVALLAVALVMAMLVGGAVPAAAQQPGDLVVSEFMANPAAVSDADGEYVELYNRSSAPIDLDGLRLRDDGSNDHPIDGTVVVEPGAFVILARSADPVGDGSVTPDYVYSSYALTNSADEIVLAVDGGVELARVVYTDGDAGGAGVALEAIDLEAGGDGALGQGDFAASTTEMSTGDFGSPGALGGSVLPVELTAFDAVLNGPAATLTWSTASETNNAGFDVLHRAGTQPWTRAGFVTGAGTTGEAQSYRFETGPLAAGPHAFRLRQIDTDGTATLGPIERVWGRPAAGVAWTGGNPLRAGTSAGLTVSVDAAGPLQVRLYNLLGQQVRTLYDGAATPSRAVETRVSAQGLPSGVYFLRVTGPRLQHTERFTVVR